MGLALVRMGVVGMFVASFAAALAAPALGSVERHRLRYGPVEIGAYETAFPRGSGQDAASRRLRTAMHARLVDRRGGR